MKEYGLITMLALVVLLFGALFLATTARFFYDQLVCMEKRAFNRSLRRWTKQQVPMVFILGDKQVIEGALDVCRVGGPDQWFLEFYDGKREAEAAFTETHPEERWHWHSAGYKSWYAAWQTSPQYRHAHFVRSKEWMVLRDDEQLVLAQRRAESLNHDLPLMIVLG